MKKNYFIVALFAGMLGLTMALLSCQQQTGAGQSESSSASQGLAPDFTLPDINGNDFSLSSTRGKVVIIDFFATWCPPCRMEIPHLVKLYDENKNKGLEIIGIALDDGGASVVRPFAAKNGVEYPVVIGNSRTADLYGGIRGIPTKFVIDRQGKITEKFVGYKSKEDMERAIEDLL